jgi:hypothetical protein
MGTSVSPWVQETRVGMYRRFHTGFEQHMAGGGLVAGADTRSLFSST